jgi:K+-sensing histidine kinase KdpD
VALRAEVPPRAAVKADPSALRQVLLNLLDNAVKYTPRGQTVSVAAQVMTRTRIVVDDQGPASRWGTATGWQGYYRLQRNPLRSGREWDRARGGARSLATEMGGRTWVEDTDTGGALSWWSWPRATEDRSETSASGGRQPRSGVRAPHLARDRGYEVLHAETGREGLATASADART